MKERLYIMKHKYDNNNNKPTLINSCDELFGACRHIPKFHVFCSSTDEACGAKRVTTNSSSDSNDLPSILIKTDSFKSSRSICLPLELDV